MKFYRYFASHAYETLLEKKLMVSRLSKFNDPFEFLYRSAGEMTIGKAKRYLKGKEKSRVFFTEFKRNNPGLDTKADFKKFMRLNRDELAAKYLQSFSALTVTDPRFREKLSDRHFRMCSLSETDVSPFDEILLWSHYAGKHSGVRIGFELDAKSKYPYFIRKIIYSKDRVGLDLTGGATTEVMASSLLDAVCTKSEGWKYEREHRLFTTPDLCEHREINGEVYSFMAFDRSIICSVDFGLKCPNSEKVKIASLVKREYPGVIVCSADYHKSDFAIVYMGYKGKPGRGHV